MVHVQCDITDLTALERVIDEREITNVIHLAALQVPFVRADPVLGARVNVLGTVNVLEAVRRRGEKMGPVVYASSIAVYGAAGTLAADDHPGTLYGVFKRDNESTALRYFEDYGVSSIGLRPHTVYGPARDQGLTSAPTTAMVAAAAHVRFHIPFGGSAQLQYAPDVGEAFALAAQLELRGRVGPRPRRPRHGDRRPRGPDRRCGARRVRADHRRRAGAAIPKRGGRRVFADLLGRSVMRPIEEGVGDAIGAVRATTRRRAREAARAVPRPATR